MSFEKYGLSPELLSGLADVRIEKPTPLQNEVLPSALQGKHMLVKMDAEDEGTFLIPALQKIAQNGEVNGTQVLILTPSIERAKKIDELIWAMGYHAQVSSALLDMKGKKDEQEKAVLDGAPVIVANPGRLIEILEKNNFHFRDLNLVVIDEAHNMENFNLVNRVKDILRFVNGEPQTLILSEKQNEATKQLTSVALKEPEMIGFDSNGQSQNNGTSSETEVDLEEAREKLQEAEVKVVLNPDEDEEQEISAEAKLEEAEVDVELDPDNEEEGQEKTAEAKLEEAEVDVELDPDNEDGEEEKEQERSAEEKLGEAEVEVNLNPDEEDTSESEVESSQEVSDENTEVDLKAAERKLQEAGVKVVLKKDLPDEPAVKEVETDTDEGDVEPVLANPILQGDEDVLPDPVPKNLEQGYINVPPRMKISTLMAHLEQSNAKKVMVFAASRRTTDRLFRIIKKKNWGVVSISDDIDDSTYDERFAKFTSGEMRVLLVGGMAAKDVEIEEVQEVINYDVPSEVEEYKYRAELVGKGKAAQIISLVSKMDRDDIKKITDQVGFPPEELPLPKELEDRKKNKTNKKNNRSKSRSNNNKGKKNSKGGRNNSGRGSGKKNKRGDKKRVKPQKLELPRPTYDGLSGGREGKDQQEKSGIFGWVKKLFD